MSVKKERILNPQQELFLERYTNPKSPTFSNALQSALEAGYKQEYAENITTLMPDLVGKKKYYQLRMFFNAINRAERRKKISEKGDHIYIVKCKQFYKIGIASNFEARLNSLQCGNPYELEIVMAVRKNNAKKLERELHNGLSIFNHKREWFLLEEDFVKDLKEFIEQYE